MEARGMTQNAEPAGALAGTPSADSGPRPIIFLDMDGVIASPRAHMVREHVGDRDLRWIDPISLALLNRLCTEHNALVVVSSVWRGDPGFREMFWRAGFTGAFHEDWRTRTEPMAGFRGDDIREWLARHPEVTQHVILDDETDFHPDQPLVVCDMYNGLHLDAYEQAHRLLQGDAGVYEWLSFRARYEAAEQRIWVLEQEIKRLTKAA